MTFGVVDLFCGVGGLTCGLRKAGLDVIAGYDLDTTCEYSYTFNNHKGISRMCTVSIVFTSSKR